jgi:hypothetical protein
VVFWGFGLLSTVYVCHVKALVVLKVQRISEPARACIEAAGGRVTRTYYHPLGMRAVLLPGWFKKKGRLLPRAVQMVPYNKQWRFDRPGTIPATDAPALEDVPPPEATAGPPPEGPSDGGSPGGGPPQERLEAPEEKLEAQKMAATG